MLKKFLHIAVSVIFLIATTGVAISMHYCHKTHSTGAEQCLATDCCDDECGCCTEITEFVKLHIDFNQPSIIDLSQFFNVALKPVLYIDVADVKPVLHPSANKPPPKGTLSYLSEIQCFLL